MKLTRPGTPGDGLPPQAPRGRAAQDLLSSQWLAEFQHFMATNTEAIARIAGGLVNNVLESGTYTFDATGTITRSYKVAAGSMEVDNLSAANSMTVVDRADASGLGGAPSQGVGMRVIPKASFRRIPMAAHSWTIYGTPGDQVSIAVYTSPALPTSSRA